METSLPTSTHERVINPFTDWGFKHVFGREENKELLMGFLNQLLKPDVPIRDIQYLNTEITPDDPELRRCLFDVLCIDEEGDYYLVEMQKALDRHIKSRLVYYVCRLVDHMGKHNQEWHYNQIKRVYAICLMDFTYEKDPTLCQHISLRSKQTGTVFSDILNIITLQIPCIRAKTLTECTESYEMLLYLLRAMSKNMKTKEELLAEIEATNLPDKELFRRVINTVTENLTAEQWAEYGRDLEKYTRTISEYRSAREAGWEQGREEGREEGRREGREEGREESQRIIAKTMKDNQAAVDFISKCTGLSVSEIESL